MRTMLTLMVALPLFVASGALGAPPNAAPSARERLAALKERVPQLDKTKRGPYAVLARPLIALGAEGLTPMLEALDAATPTAWTESARVAWRASLLDAVGELRDPKAAPVAESILATESEPHIAFAAAEVLAKLGDDPSVQRLIGLASAPGDKRLVAVKALGSCRRSACAKALANLLNEPLPADLMEAAVKALGRSGSAWAWETSAHVKSPEKHEARLVAARALTKRYAATEDTSGAIEKALLMVDLPETPALIAEAKGGASEKTKARLTGLAKRFEKNPLRSTAGAGN